MPTALQKWFRVDAVLRGEEGFPVNFQDFESPPVAWRMDIDMTLVNFPRKLLAELSIISDEQFLFDLPRLLVTYLDVDLAYIGLIDEKNPAVIEAPYLHTKHCLEKRSIEMKGRYGIAGSACELTLKQGRYVHVGGYRTALEPAALMEDQNFESYAGASLIDSCGTATGVLVLLSSKPLVCANELLQSLEQIANRASVVLEKMRMHAKGRGETARQKLDEPLSLGTDQ